MRLVVLAVALIVVALTGGRADAYPQYQLSYDQTCTGCHLSPAGGNLLNENGLAAAESMSQFGTAPEFFYGKLGTPDWLHLGGDLRGSAGYIQTPEKVLAAFPMQLELYASAKFDSFTVHLNFSPRPSQFGNRAATSVWAREHYVMWQQKPGETTGLYVRAGRLMPTFGLRLAEHVVYTQKLGGRPLYGEAYAAAVSYVLASFEIHASGFLHDSIASAVEHGDGGALYAEKRLGEHAAVGVEGKYATDTDQHRLYAGITGKLYLPGPDVLLQAEGEVIRTRISAGTGDRYTQLAGYVLATKPLAKGLSVDAGLGHFTQDTRVKGLYRDCLDVNVHWFMTSHVEWLATLRAELLDGGGGPNGGYALAQLHYRL